jgi:hypothetical protein
MKMETICPDCGQKHKGAELIEGTGKADNGFGVCANCGAIFAVTTQEGKREAHSLSPAQLIKVAERFPQIFYKLTVASTEIKNYLMINQKN